MLSCEPPASCEPAGLLCSRPMTVTPLGLTIYGLAITFMGRQKQKNRWIPGAGIELTAIAMSIPVSYQLRYQIDFEISAG